MAMGSAACAFLGGCLGGASGAVIGKMILGKKTIASSGKNSASFFGASVIGVLVGSTIGASLCEDTCKPAPVPGTVNLGR
jgi:hypothetical protein